MKKFVILALLLLLPMALCAAEQPASGAGYQYKLEYQGMYQIDRLYKLHWKKNMWFADNNLKFWGSLRCVEARTTLDVMGQWVGNLSDSGECRGKAEAPKWATGNYLNYLQTGKIKE